MPNIVGTCRMGKQGAYKNVFVFTFAKFLEKIKAMVLKMELLLQHFEYMSTW